jgi:hypothetical protein
MIANALKDWQYDDMYKQKAMAKPATRQLVLEEVLRTNLAAKGRVMACISGRDYLSQECEGEDYIGGLLGESGVFGYDSEVGGGVDGDDSPEVHESDGKGDHEGTDHAEEAFEGSVLNHVLNYIWLICLSECT